MCVRRMLKPGLSNLNVQLKCKDFFSKTIKTSLYFLPLIQMLIPKVQPSRNNLF